MHGPPTTLVVVRGWSEELDPRHPLLVQRLRDAGIDVIEVYLPADDSPSFEHWADRYVEAIESHVPDRDRPLRCLGYCIGGNILVMAAEALAARGRRFDYIGLVDVRAETTLQRLANNMHHRAKVPRRVRLRLFLMSTGTPQYESVRAIVRAWALARVRTFGGFFTKGPRSVRARRDPAWHILHLSYGAMPKVSRLPHHRYVARESVDKSGDTSLNTATFDRGGYAIRVVGGNHYTCITEPHLDGLVRAIVTDLHNPPSLFIEIDRGQTVPGPRSDP